MTEIINMKVKYINWRQILHKPLTSIARLVLKHKVRLVRNDYLFNGKPIIYTITHVFKDDIASILCCLQNNAYVLVGNAVRKSFDGFVIWLNGVILVDRSDKASRAIAKEKMVAYLRQGDDVLIAPEATHNFTPNLLVMKLWWGLLDVARIADANIVPVAVDLVNDEYCVIIGESFHYIQYSDKTEAIESLREVMATMIWELYEMKPKAKRADVSEEQFSAYINGELARMPYSDLEYENNFIRT